MSADGISKRLSRLEASHSPPCEECGHAPGEAATAYEVEWADGPKAVEPETCRACGEPLVYVATWGDMEGEGVVSDLMRRD